ncbi:hypothetical protein FAZ69_04475 [Trinickia terrae]|uniref:Uncharacterized protein n=1 Tax=Trinickia terrae TaxID=2571161 RepID=A0A4U1IDG3_9BURK|nr:hypothetical protein [Trinickia terrae]TKC91703.1 hypothetical protein FAZ69_04475 [Trinickia terrae]
MRRENLIGAFRAALSSIIEPRFFETERGFQGALIIELHRRVPLTAGTVIEQEYQKRLLIHGISQRPDIVIHEPFDPSRHRARTDGNHAVLEIKRRSTERQAILDFEKLRVMTEVLDYPLAMFVNIDSAETYVEVSPPELRDRLICFAVYRGDTGTEVIERRA